MILPHYNHDRNKTFFFFSWEGERRSQALSYLTTVPVPAFRRGDFSASNSLIYDPLSAVALANGKVQRTAFPGNKIRLATSTRPVRIHNEPVPPIPTLPGGHVSNYASNPSATVNRDNFDIKVDQNFTQKIRRFSATRTSTDQNTPGPLPLPAIGSANASTILYPLDQLVMGYTRTLTPNLINEARAGATRLNTQAHNPNYGKNVSDQVGIPGVNSGSNPIDTGLTQINLAGYAPLGDSGFYPAIIANNNFQFNDAMTWVHGAHTFKFGGEILRRQENVLQSSALHGIESFGPIYTTNPASPAGTGISLADLLLGAPPSGNIAYLTGTIGNRRTDYGLFAQDTWKVSSKLTLTLGVRYDLFPDYPWVEVANRVAYFRPDLGGVYNVGSSQIPWRSGVAPRYNDFGPRVGLAYRLGDKTVIRSAFGTFFAPDPGMTLGNTNPPFNGSVSFTNNQFDFQGAQLVSEGFNRPPNLVFSPLGASLVGIGPNLKTPTAAQWNVSVQRNLPGNLLLTTAYVGTSGKHLLLEPNINQPTPGAGAVNARRPFPQYSDITWNESSGSSTYHSLQISAEKRLSGGIDFLASLHLVALDRFRTAMSEAGRISTTWKAERGNGDSDLRNRFVLSAVWQIPFGQGRKFGSWAARPIDWIAGGWQVNTISSIYSGLPFTPTSSVNTLNTGGGQRPNRISPGVLAVDQRTIQRWFDITAFQTPGLYQYGNSARNILFGPGTVQFDIALAKSFFFSSDRARNLEFRAESFSMRELAAVQQSRLAQQIGSAGAGVIGSAGSPVGFQRTSREIQ